MSHHQHTLLLQNCSPACSPSERRESRDQQQRGLHCTNQSPGTQPSLSRKELAACQTSEKARHQKKQGSFRHWSWSLRKAGVWSLGRQPPRCEQTQLLSDRRHRFPKWQAVCSDLSLPLSLREHLSIGSGMLHRVWTLKHIQIIQERHSTFKYHSLT